MEGVFIPLGGRTSDTGACPAEDEGLARVIVSNGGIAHGDRHAASVSPVRRAYSYEFQWVINARGLN